jgi:hypothetical protein
MINERRFSNDKDEKRDLLSNLVDANEEFSDDGEQRLGEEELIGTRSTARSGGPLILKSAVQETFLCSTLLDTR